MNAGVIPRTLCNLFYALDKQSAEYYVRVSYVELYNEELRDLLAGTSGISNEDILNGRLPEPSGGSHLKVYESGTDKGVIIQGLEDRIVTNAKDAVAVMQAGAMRRKVAATRCNDSSSRSHAIFTITVFIRERAVTVDGEDIVKLGKLNLVDLAGSENIGRSGAKDQRAKEAGSINQSLLVLGRVINALVERNSYVPYRDSKLTYVLKDSLGGRTRTCMIATISNANANIEETIKTLQYASQAKGIRNRPVANKKVSKSEIVHDMQLQIEQLKRDLEAARDSQGFYITKDSYEELTEHSKSSKELVEEWKQRVALWEEEMKRMNDRHEELTRENERHKSKLEMTQNELSVTTDHLEQKKTELSNQVLLTRAHAHHEDNLNETAHHLHGSLAMSKSDNQDLHQKLERMSERERLNLQAVASISQLVGEETSQALRSVKEYNQNAHGQTQSLLETLQDRVGPGFEQRLGDQIQAIRQTLLDQQIQGSRQQSEQTHQQVADSHSQTLASVDELMRGLVGESQQITKQCSDICQQLKDSIKTQSDRHSGSLQQAMGAVREMLTQCVDSACQTIQQSQTHNTALLQQMETATAQAKQQNANDIAALQARMDVLAKESKKTDETTLQAIREMMEQRRQREAGTLREVMETAQAQSFVYSKHATEVVEKMGGMSQGIDQTMSSVSADIQQTQSNISQQLSGHSQVAAEITDELSSVGNHHSEQISNSLGQISSTAVTTSQKVSGHSGQLSRQLSGLCQSNKQQWEQMQTQTQDSAQQLTGAIGSAVSTWSKARQEMGELAQSQSTERDGFAKELGRGITSIATTVDRETSANIQATGLTGSTPQKSCQYSIIHQWNVTRPHQDILDKMSEGSLEDLAWTGQPASRQQVDVPMEESRTTTPTLSGGTTVDDEMVVSPTVRKRSSESSEIDGVEMTFDGPPAQKARHSKQANGTEDVSGIPRPARRSARRTRN